MVEAFIATNIQKAGLCL